MNRKIAIAVNASWNLFNFRTGLIRALIAGGYQVVTLAPVDEYVPRLEASGCRHVAVPMESRGTNPASDMLLFYRFLTVLRRERPAVFLGYTIKPNVYGSLAAGALGIPVINNIAGLGTAFHKESYLTTLARMLYRLALRRSSRVFFQNEDDRRQFIAEGLVQAGRTERIPGSGVDLDRFAPNPVLCPAEGRVLKKEGQFRFLLVARMLWDKGVREYVEAARRIRARRPSAECCLLGPLEVQNPAAISRAQMDAWSSEGVVRYLGVSDDVRVHLVDADCVVLPSYYREGVPRSLLEAAAMGCAVIASDSTGCRETVDGGVTGLLCRPRDVVDLVEKMEQMLAMTREARATMGRRGREKVEREFDERIVIERYLGAIRELLDRSGPS